MKDKTQTAANGFQDVMVLNNSQGLSIFKIKTKQNKKEKMDKFKLEMNNEARDFIK